MPFKVTNHPPRPRQARSSVPRSNSGSSEASHAVTVNQAGSAAEDCITPEVAEPVAYVVDKDIPQGNVVDQAERFSLHSGSEETACSPTSSLGDQLSLGLEVTKSGDNSTAKKVLEQQFKSPGKIHLPRSPDMHKRKEHVGESDDYNFRADYISISMKSPDLSHALGPDNVCFTTEIDSIPCAGVRIAFGPLAGLLAWRLVVRRPLPIGKQKRSWWDTTEQKRVVPHPLVHQNPSQGSFSGSSVVLEKQRHLRSSRSAASLPLPHLQNSKQVPEMHHHRERSEAQHPLVLGDLASSRAIVANFVLDTSSPFSIISRETLISLGYSPDEIPSSQTSHTSPFHTETEPVVILSVQNVRTQFRIAQDGEVSRLGVQFMQDANASLFFPREHGIGPILYYDSARPLRDVPATVPLDLHHHYPAGKLSLPQRIRLIFGLSS